MTNEPAAQQPSARRGCLAILVLVAVIVAIVVIVAEVWPKSEEERSKEAVDACKEAVDQKMPTDRRKSWSHEDESVSANGKGF